MITFKTFLIACPLVFLAGFVDSIAGGGGLISMSIYVFLGLPIRTSIGTNKLSSAMGLGVSAIRVSKKRPPVWKMLIPCIIVTFIGSWIGANITLGLDESIMEKIMLIILPICAFLVLNKKLLAEVDNKDEVINSTTIVKATLISLVLGVYDGFYGAGTGTFLLMSFLMITKLSVDTAYSQKAIINLSSAIVSLVAYLNGGAIAVPLGLACGACNMIGQYIGMGLALKNGMKIVRPLIIVVVALFMIKIIFKL